jgi:hypothetical protein
VRALGLLTAAFAATLLGSGCGNVTGLASADGGGGVQSMGGDDSGFAPGDASSCHPGDVETYVPKAYRPASAASTGACQAGGSTDLFQQFYAACLGPHATQPDCVTFADSNAACSSCLLTPSAAARYGPLVGVGGFIVPNVAGCLELVGALHPAVDAGIDPGALPCAKAVQALEGCELTACEANCPVSDAASLSAYYMCASDADKSGCQLYANMAAACGGSYRDAGPGANSCPDAGAALTAADCFAPFKDFFNKVAPLFCGAPMTCYVPPPPLDAGAGPDAGSTAMDGKAD